MKRIIILILSVFAVFSATASNPKKTKVELAEVVFNVHLHCSSCVKKIQENIAFEKGVKDLKVSLEEQTIMVKFDPSKTSEEILKKAIEKLGIPVIEEKEHDHSHEHDHGHHDHKHHNHK